MSVTASLTTADVAQLAARGMTPEVVAAQLQRLRNPPPAIVLDRPCTIGDGIVRLDADTSSRLLERADEAAAAGRVTKFVPASGAATRMFKELVAALQMATRPSEDSAVRELFTRLDEFPFGDEVRRRTGLSGLPGREIEERIVLRTLLDDMGLAAQPKALVPFHKVGRVRTAFEEHLLEGTRYARGADGTCRMHFTVAPDTRPVFVATLAALTPIVEQHCRGAVLEVAFSEQHPSTDTVAIDADGELFRNADGSLLFRPSGHGALLRNLQELNGDLVAIKNIDNILPDEANDEAVHWKRLLIGYLTDLQADVFAHLAALEQPGVSEARVNQALAFAQKQFARTPDAGCRGAEARRRFAIDALDRPLRVCGVVRNEGEPGGAPFWVVDRTNRRTVQIVEPSQVDTTDAGQAALLRSATHFNPVDLVCTLRSWRGRGFDLERFVDEDTAFVVKKSADGRDLIALERPGLWNGAMAGWNTVCVEVPAATFAPVKTVLDLLRPQHQP